MNPEKLGRFPTKSQSVESITDDYSKIDLEYKELYNYASSNNLPLDSAEFKRLAEIADSLLEDAVNKLPEIKEGFTRLLHSTGSVETAKSIATTGLRFHDGLAYTVYSTKDMSNFFITNKQTADDIRKTGIYMWNENTSVVFDVPDDVLKDFLKPKEGALPAEYFVAILPSRAPIVRKDNNVLLPSERILDIQL